MARRPAADASKRRTPKPRSGARRQITAQELSRIRELIRTWPAEPMKWDLVRDAVVRDVQFAGGASGGRQGWTRQAIAAHPDIAKAYRERKAELLAERKRVLNNPRRNRDPETVVLRRQVDVLRIKVKDLEAKLAAYDERFQTLLYNTALGAQTPDDLLRPLSPKIDPLGRRKR